MWCKGHAWREAPPGAPYASSPGRRADRPADRSPTAHTHRRRLLCFPRGNGAAAADDDGARRVSLYLAPADLEGEPEGWSHAVSFKLTMLNIDSDESLSKETSHHFSAAQHDWGFTRSAPAEAAVDAAHGFNLGGVVRIRIEFESACGAEAPAAPHAPDVAAIAARLATAMRV